MKIRLADGSGTIDLKHLTEDVDRHGNVRIYYRRKGQPKIRLLTELGSEAFLEEYRLAATGVRAQTAKPAQPVKAARGSTLWIVREYYETAAYKNLDPQVRLRRGRMLDDFCARRGALPFAKMEARHIRKERDRFAAVPGSGNDWLKAIRGVYAFAKADGHVAQDPSRDVPYFSTTTDGFHTWSVDEVLQFIARHPLGTKAHLALGLFLFLGARVSDIAKFGRQMESNGVIKFKETKGRKKKVKEREIPILPVLRQIIDASPNNHLTYIVTEFGKPFSTKGLGNRMKKWCVEAGLPHCSAHGLRKAGATIAADNGATAHQLMGLYGWETLKQAEGYTRKANRKRLTAAAARLITLEQDEDEIVPPEMPMAESGTNTAKKA